ncbi:YALI0C02497p [Yarrowia lipolytica CLIB122]|uniref:YALI0C02497p n=2 Tax=Yarrowia lipolytica TaxID=4952 RepID=Q6CDA0_YARLI|nr:YALI0C02497p [Yarrowia lipolytica CLIB122]AOW02242.1 hypothetical protein YALI1_C03513g [Yarrowia lipolytica]KAB8283552.1 hypothetical protein BKA91DRAFT_136531 [Yarrowia lipolytica]KAE8172059.1 hypothetical protein BKA90DRAFT_112679 [Yarrowia lipolytica]KAJ8052979.1 hypothetical protein LXG23DRAFT_49284 [Yarrowia lipolytica]RMI94990.1 hypothetical protein BD777DRAFT_130614 [Yarrowia lipolytica]|eukprot:XP_501362.1 YALI0C02497p [Yarrowia lipolytica CLIB122]
MDLTSMMNEENEAPSHVTQDGGSENNRDVMNQQPGPGGPGGPGGPTHQQQHQPPPLQQAHLVPLNSSSTTTGIAPVPVLDKEAAHQMEPRTVQHQSSVVNQPPSSPPPLNAMGFPRYKSYKKKYKKMLIRFNSCMARSTEIFRDDLRARKIYSRIVRENMTLLGLMQRKRGEVKDSDVEEDLGPEVDDEAEEAVVETEDDNTIHGLSVKLMEKATNDAYQSVRSEEVTELNPNSIGMWLKRNHSILNTEEDPQEEGRKRRKGPGGEENRKRTKRGSMSQGSS